MLCSSPAIVSARKPPKNDEARKPMAMDLPPPLLGLVGISSCAVQCLGRLGDDKSWRSGLDAYGLPHAEEIRRVLSDCAGRSGCVVPCFMENCTAQLRTGRSYYEHDITSWAGPIHHLVSARHNDSLVKNEPNGIGGLCENHHAVCGKSFTCAPVSKLLVCHKRRFKSSAAKLF